MEANLNTLAAWAQQVDRDTQAAPAPAPALRPPSENEAAAGERLGSTIRAFARRMRLLRVESELADAARQLQLVEDMQALPAERRPLLTKWSVVNARGAKPDPYLAPELRPSALAGNVFNHPLRPDGDTVATNRLRYLHYKQNAHLGIAVTDSRAYLLGTIDADYASYRAERGLSTTEIVMPVPEPEPDSTKRKHESSDEDDVAEVPSAPSAPPAAAAADVASDA